MLKQCLRGIQDYRLSLDFEVIVVDNNSGDGSPEMVRALFPEVHLIVAPRNDGFASGNNLGIQAARGRYVMIMNPDVAMFAGAVEELCAYLDQHPRTGIVAPKLINPDGSTQNSTYLFPSFWIPLLRRTPLGRLPGARQVLRRYLMNDWDHQDTRSIGWALGACLVIRSEILQAVGGFDEDFFLYVEDTDLCRRIWAAGWEVVYVHTAEMVHYHKRESAETKGLQGLFAYPTRVHVNSWLTYFRKWQGQPKPPHSL